MSAEDWSEFEQLRHVSFWMGLTCTILNFFVLMTFVVFEEKRKATWAPLNYAFTFSIFFFSLVFTTSVGIEAEVLVSRGGLCSFLGSSLFFFAASLVYLWSFITIHLYVRMVRNQEISRVMPMVFFAYGGSIPACIIPNIVPGFSFNGAFCMIPYDNVLWKISIGFFISCALIGIFFWISILFSIMKNYREKKNKAKMKSAIGIQQTPRTSTASSSAYYYSSSYPYPPSGIQHQEPSPEAEKEDWRDKYLLVFRQFIFVTAFLIAIIVLGGVHLGDMEVTNPQLATSIECATLCLISLDSFLVFGISKQNFDLWSNSAINLFSSTRRRYTGIW